LDEAVAAKDGSVGVPSRIALRIAQVDRAGLMAADAVLATEEVALEGRDAVAVEGVDQAPLRVERQHRADGRAVDRLKDAERRLRPDEVVVTSQETARVLHRQGKPLAAARVERIVPAVINVHGPQRRVVDECLGCADGVVGQKDVVPVVVA
jgi:hypothetical protein